MFLESLANKFIRPARFSYSKHNLGPTSFLVEETFIGNRYDFTLLNRESLTLHCSIYEAVGPQSKRSCVIYLHCNTGSRLDVKPYLSDLLSQGFSVCAFDFSGCGLSEGMLITLGHKEKDDVSVVLDYLDSLQRYESFFLWGRSMGAVTALFYAVSCKKNLVKGMILDSSFISLRRMVLEYMSEVSKLPEILLYPLIPLMNRILREKIGLDFGDYELREHLSYIQNNTKIIPPNVLFLASKNDNVVKSSHSEELMKHYPGKNKKLTYISEKHGDDRSKKVIRECVRFLVRCLEEPRNKITEENNRLNNGYLSHFRAGSSSRITKGSNSMTMFYQYGDQIYNANVRKPLNNVYINNYSYQH